MAKLAFFSQIARNPPVIRQCGPFDRPGLVDGDLLCSADQFRQPVDQILTDRAFATPVDVLLDRSGGFFLVVPRRPVIPFIQPAFLPLGPLSSSLARSEAVSGSTQGPIRAITTVMLSIPPRRLARWSK